jgi:hypothetical protein
MGCRCVVVCPPMQPGVRFLVGLEIGRGAGQPRIASLYMIWRYRDATAATAGLEQAEWHRLLQVQCQICGQVDPLASMQAMPSLCVPLKARRYVYIRCERGKEKVKISLVSNHRPPTYFGRLHPFAYIVLSLSLSLFYQIVGATCDMDAVTMGGCSSSTIRRHRNWMQTRPSPRGSS